MSRKFTLEEFAAESEKRFGSLTIGEITFRPVLRLSDAEREVFTSASQELDALHAEASLYQLSQEREAENKVLAEKGEELLPVIEAREVTPAEIREKTVAVLAATTLQKKEFAEWSSTLVEADIYTVLGMYTEDSQLGEV